MKFIKGVEIIPLYNETVVTMHIDNRFRQNAVDILRDLEPGIDYDIKVEKRRNKRSKDANAYCWALISKLAEKLGKSTRAVYRELIRDMPTYEIVPIREDAVEHWTKTWRSHGIGWVVMDMGECRNFKGYHNLKCHYGSSSFNSKEMSQFLDIIIEECRSQGIEHLNPDEVRRLKEEWS